MKSEKEIIESNYPLQKMAKIHDYLLNDDVTEIMLNAVNIALAAISYFTHDLTGQIFAFFIIAVAASEVAVGLGLLILWYKRNGSIDLNSLQMMKG